MRTRPSSTRRARSVRRTRTARPRPNAFDCSGLVYWSYKNAGKTIPRDSYGQMSGGKAVAYKDAKPGDVLIFNGGSHSGIYVGNGEFVHSQNYGTPVNRAKVKTWALTAVRRY